jgi:hypothetical protein
MIGSINIRRWSGSMHNIIVNLGLNLPSAEDGFERVMVLARCKEVGDSGVLHHPRSLNPICVDFFKMGISYFWGEITLVSDQHLSSD